LSGRRILIAAAALMVLGLAVGLGALAWYRTYRPDPSRYPVRGVDVSHHQGPIDWEALAADEVAFAYVKASEGATWRDTMFERNWREARQAGLAVGAYHFFTLCRPGRVQAANFLAAAPRPPNALPPAVDLEFGGNCGARPDGPAMRRELDDFLTRVEARAGKRAVLYVTAEFVHEYGCFLPRRALWRRSIARHPKRPWAVWQYHNRGEAAGVAGPVDLNVFAEGPEAFAHFARTGAVSDARPARRDCKPVEAP
jgi:lysozyme